MSLQPSSLALARRDMSLPGLRLLLDETALARQLGARKVTRIYLRYKPGVSCIAGLCVTGTDGDEKWLCAKAYTTDRFEQIKSRSNWQSGLWPVALFNGICVAFIPPQRDRRLKALSKLLHPEKGAKTLAQILGGSFVSPTLKLLRYKPNRRLVAKVVDGASAQQAILKIQNPSAFDAAERGARAAMTLGSARLLATDPQRGAVVCDWVPGTSLCPVSGWADPALYAMAGAQIARHHQSSVKLPDLRRLSEIQALKDVTADLSDTLPHHADRLRDIARQATQALLTQPTRHGLIHGDFSADQVVHSSGAVCVIDWDRAATGDQGRDIGSFLARLDMQELSGLIASETAASLKAAFLDGYCIQQTLPASYQVQHICHLVLLLTEPFRMQSPDWEGQICALMDHVEARLAAVPPALHSDTALPHLVAALTGDVAGPLIKAQTALSLTAPPALYRHKPGKRAMIRYECHTRDGRQRTLLGKMRSKGRDLQAPVLHTAFRAAGLDEQGPVGVPRVVDIPNDWNMWFMEKVPGICLRDLQEDRQTDTFERSGAALGHLHRCGVVPEKVWTHAQEMNVLTTALEKAGTVSPRQYQRLQALVKGAGQVIDALPDQPLACIHRDFYPDQVLVHADQIWFVDLDLVALGDPAIDVGNFLAHLAEYAMRTTGSAKASRWLEAAFLRGYQITGHDICPHRISAFRAISLLRHIHISQRFEDRKHTANALITEGEALLASV